MGERGSAKNVGFPYKAPERYPRAALRWHGRLCREVDVSLEEAQAVLAEANSERGFNSRLHHLVSPT